MHIVVSRDLYTIFASIVPVWVAIVKDNERQNLTSILRWKHIPGDAQNMYLHMQNDLGLWHHC